jgi:hypothetical protein
VEPARGSYQSRRHELSTLARAPPARMMNSLGRLSFPGWATGHDRGR